LLPVPFDSSSLVIIEAWYCKRKDERNYRTNVTEKLQRHLGNASTLHIDPFGYRAIFGDPYPGTFFSSPKLLIVKYRDYGQLKEIRKSEEESLSLPESKK